MQLGKTVFLAGGLALLLSGCGTEPAPSPKPKSRPAHLVEVAPVRQGALALQLVRTGTLRASREVRIFNQVDGRIERLPYYQGDRVAQGTLLVVLDRTLLAAEQAKAEAQLKQAESDLQRLRGLVREQLVSEEELARARTALQVAQAEARLLRTRLNYTQISAPFDGVVTERLWEPGDVAPRHSHILTLMDPASLITEVQVSELTLPALREGDPVSIRIDALGSRQFRGRIQRIHPQVDARTRLGRVEIALDPVPQGAHPGQLCRVTLSGEVAERLSIPFSALRRAGADEFVFLVDAQGVVQRRVVESGLRVAEQVEIRAGLGAGESVVTKGFLGLSAGKKVRVVTPDAAEAGV